MIALLMITDGRHDLLERTHASALQHLQPWSAISQVVLVNDSPAQADIDRLDKVYGDELGYVLLHPPNGERTGFAGAIERGWRYLRRLDGSVRFVFHLEDDFKFNRTVDLRAMATVLTRNRHIVQMALRRQPWNDAERAAGGVVEQWPDEYIDKATESEHDGPVLHWLEHRLFFTTNPSMYRVSLCELGWPRGDKSEQQFTHEVLSRGYLDQHGRDPGTLRGSLERKQVVFAYWGARNSGEWVEHIGRRRTRAGQGY